MKSFFRPINMVNNRIHPQRCWFHLHLTYLQSTCDINHQQGLYFLFGLAALQLAIPAGYTFSVLSY